MDSSDGFVGFEDWFGARFGAPTAVQRAAWPLLRRRRHALLIASTGQGKTLAAWRPLVERLCVQPPCSGVREIGRAHV